MTVQLLDVTLIGTGYLIGSVASAIVVCRIWRLPDPRWQGSGNPGATNVLRMGGKAPAAATLIGDVLKGVLPVTLGQWLNVETTTLAAIALAAFLGHLYPVFFNFQGGKGVATAFGALIGIAPWAALITVGIWLLVALTTRLSSLAALSASIVAPLLLWWLDQPQVISVALVIIAMLLVWRHRDNIQRLRAGQEQRIGEKS
jgi:glycerol-3-phosphate acyltransferase PlsY